MANGVSFRNPGRAGMLIQPNRLLAALHDGLELVGQVVESAALVAGDTRWEEVGQQIRKAARGLAP